MNRRNFLKTTGKSGLSFILGASFLAGCEFKIFNPSWVDLEKMEPWPEFPLWWKEISQCSGLHGDLKRINWWLILKKDIPCYIDEKETACYGIWQEPHNIYLSKTVLRQYNSEKGTLAYEESRKRVQHEMLHDLLGTNVKGHPYVFDYCDVR